MESIAFPRVGVERVVAEELEERAVKNVGAAPGHNVDIGPGVPPETGVVKAGLHLEFLNRVGIWDRYSAAETAASLQVIDLDAVHLEVVIRAARAVCAKIPLGLTALTAAQRAGVGHRRGDAGRERDDLRIVARDQRQVAD